MLLLLSVVLSCVVFVSCGLFVSCSERVLAADMPYGIGPRRSVGAVALELFACLSCESLMVSGYMAQVHACRPKILAVQHGCIERD